MTEAAAPITVVSAGAVEYVIRQLASRYQAAGGAPVDFTFRTIAGVKKLLTEGRRADIVIGTTGAIREMDEAGSLVPGTRVEIGSTETGICVRQGSPVPDISTREKLRDLLSDARAVAYSNPEVGGSSGIYLVKLMAELGILAQVQKKSVLCKNGEDIVRAVASGQADVGSTFVSEFPLAEGITSAGAIPAAFGNSTSYAGALHVSGSGSQAARGFLAALCAPEHRKIWSSNGFTPAS